MVLMSAWLGRVLIVWARYMSGIEAALEKRRRGRRAAARADQQARTRPAVAERKEPSRRPPWRASNCSPGRRGRRASSRWRSGSLGAIICAGSVGGCRDPCVARKRARSRDRRVGRGAIFAARYLALAIGSIVTLGGGGKRRQARPDRLQKKLVRFCGDVFHRGRARQQRAGAADDLGLAGNVRRFSSLRTAMAPIGLDLAQPLMEFGQPALSQSRGGREGDSLGVEVFR